MGIPLHAFLKNMIDMGGSDLLLASGFPPAMRIYGRMEPSPLPPVESDDIIDLLQQILLPQEYDRLRDSLNIDFAYEGDIPEIGVSRFRCNAFVQRKGLSCVFRLIPWEAPSMQELQLPDALASLSKKRNGLLLLTGPAGCGKTSTMAALCRHINETRSVNMIMIEDPIEYVHHDKKALIVQRQVGMHVSSFHRALMAALREDPDIIVVGELRDMETIQLALTAAETGHLVIATMHTTNAVQTLSRIVSTFPASQQWQIRAMLADSLRAIFSQQLVARKDGKGRAPACELLLNNDAVANMIREERFHHIPSTMESSVNRGMLLMDMDLVRLVEADLVDAEEALFKAHNKLDFNKRLETAIEKRLREEMRNRR